MTTDKDTSLEGESYPVWAYYLAIGGAIIGGISSTIDAYISKSVLPVDAATITGLTALLFLWVGAVQGFIIYVCLSFTVARVLPLKVRFNGKFNHVRGRKLLWTVVSGVIGAIGQGIAILALQQADATLVTIAAALGVINLGIIDMITLKETKSIRRAWPFIAICVLGATVFGIKKVSLRDDFTLESLVAIVFLVVFLRNTISAGGSVIERYITRKDKVGDDWTDEQKQLAEIKKLNTKYEYTLIRFGSLAVTATLLAIVFCIHNDCLEEFIILLQHSLEIVLPPIAILSVVTFTNSMVSTFVSAEMPVLAQSGISTLRPTLALVFIIVLSASALPGKFGDISSDPYLHIPRVIGLFAMLYGCFAMGVYFKKAADEAKKRSKALAAETTNPPEEVETQPADNSAETQ